MDVSSGLDIIARPPKEDTHEPISVHLRDRLAALVLWRPMGMQWTPTPLMGGCFSTFACLTLSISSVARLTARRWKDE